MWLLRISLFMAFCSICVPAQSSKRPPVFLLNGMLGAKLYIQENGVQYPPELKCSPSEEYRKIWIRAELLMNPPFGDQECEFFRLRPVFNSSEKTYHDQPGVNISTPFGDLDPLRCLMSDGGPLCQSVSRSSSSDAYYYYFVKSLKKLYNFTEGETLIGAAYDWRYSPEMQKKYFESLKSEIEQAVERTGLKAFIVAHSMGNKMVNYFLTRETTPEWRAQYMNRTINVAPAFGGSPGTLKELATEMQKKYFESLKSEIEQAVERTGLKAFIVAHSMGNKMVNYFLTRETTPEWRAQYMNRTINVAPAFGGSPGTLKELATGRSVIFVPREVARDFARSLPSMASLLPSLSLFNSSRILVSVGNKSFTSANIAEFLTLSNSSDLLSHFGQSEEMQPDVPMLVVIGNLPKSTPSRYSYAHSLSDEPVEEAKVDGDKRIEAAVIEELCQRWNKTGSKIEVKHLSKEHTELIMSSELVHIFGDALVGKLPDGQRFPMLRNAMLDRGDKVCFSAEPHDRCHSGTPALKSLVQVVPFVCFGKDAEVARELKKQRAKNMIFELTEYKVAFSASVEVAQICMDI